MMYKTELQGLGIEIMAEFIMCEKYVSICVNHMSYMYFTMLTFEGPQTWKRLHFLGLVNSKR